jgi:hypothetical protein
LSLRFSDHGPEFPTPLVDALIAGEVVFLCGTGISAPQLPDFKLLVDRTYQGLGVEMDDSEQRSYSGQRFEEVLGALGRRLADPEAMVRTVSALLAVPASPRLDQHRTVLRLSRDLNNRILTVTTNFDTLLERATGQPAASVRQNSYAGQSLPAPSGAGFSGIIHIHGRLADPTLDLDATPLVLTSADYGDAYMRSGWASRFLFDLARCKTIVLIGYSANDAPVRYFLNVLEADRARFPDLLPVYAFDAYEHDPVEAEAGWGALAVMPLVYCKLNPATGVPDHSPLWGDLQQLADIIERPKRSREDRARNILTDDSGSITDRKLREISWLFTDHSDLWPVALEAIADPNWFRIFQEHKLWSTRDAAWVVSTWIAQNFENRQRFNTAVEWHAILGRDLFARLDQRLRQNPPPSPFWVKAWRVLLSSRPTERTRVGGFDERAYAVKQKLESGLILDTELVQSVSLLVPVLVARRPLQIRADENDAADDEEPAKMRLSDIVALNLAVGDEYGATEIISALDTLDEHAVRILELVSEAMRSSLQQAVDLEMILDGYDRIDSSVPSIEEHGQNEHRDGMIFLVRAVVNAFTKAVFADRIRARAQTAQWGYWPGRLGVRLLLHVSRDTEAFSADEALKVLIDIDDNIFWSTPRETALALRERAAAAAPALRSAVEARVLTSGDAYYARYPLAEGQVDWRAHARDSAVWLRLKMLEEAGALSDEGRVELIAIVGRRPYLDRLVKDRDFFGSYSFGVRTVVGDSAPIIAADPDDRLQVAVELSQSSDIDRQLGWQSYCHSDAKGAFDTLIAAELTSPNILLWGDLLATLAFQKNNTEAAIRDQLAVDSLARLEGLDIEALRPIVASAVDLIRFASRLTIARFEDWCDRLWEAVLAENPKVDFGTDLYETAINHPAGRLAETLLTELNRSQKETGPNQERQRERLAVVAGANSSAGTIARAVLVHDFAFLLSADRPLIEDHILLRLNGDDDEGRALRAVLVSNGQISPEVSKIASEVVLRGVIEARPDSSFAAQISSGILRPALASLRGDDPDLWGISEADVSRALRLAPVRIRTGALDVLVGWMHQDEAGAEGAWEKMVAPFFDRVWPKERRFVDDALNRGLMSLAVGAGKCFPAALAKLRPYFRPFVGERGGIHPLAQSEVPELFPDQVLDLIWVAFGPTSATSYDMADILDRLVAANPKIAVDRRFQSLEQRTTRYQ